MTYNNKLNEVHSCKASYACCRFQDEINSEVIAKIGYELSFLQIDADQLNDK